MPALSHRRAGRIIDMADQNPESQGKVVRHAAALLGVILTAPQSLEVAH